MDSYAFSALVSIYSSSTGVCHSKVQCVCLWRWKSMSAGAKAGLSQSSCENSRAPWNKGIKNDNTVVAGRFHQLLIFGFLHLIHSQNEKRGKTQAYPLKNNLLGKKCSVLFVSLKLTFSCFCTSNRKGSKSTFLPGLFFLLCHLAAQEISTLLLNLRKRNEKNLFIFSPKVEWPHFLWLMQIRRRVCTGWRSEWMDGLTKHQTVGF